MDGSGSRTPEGGPASTSTSFASDPRGSGDVAAHRPGGHDNENRDCCRSSDDSRLAKSAGRAGGVIVLPSAASLRVSGRCEQFENPLLLRFESTFPLAAHPEILPTATLSIETSNNRFRSPLSSCQTARNGDM